jgi:adenine-specific DNA-methyltransferase
MQKLNEIGYENDLISIEYIPKTGKNKGNIYTQYYKGDKYNLFAWLSDVTEEKEGKLFKKTLQGTYWDYTAETKNLTKEGGIQFPNGKKPEALIARILEMATDEGDLVLDSFLGSGTTIAVAHKMNRRWIGIEMGDQAYTHCKVRMDKIIRNLDNGGITKNVNWQGGGGYRFYELAPTLIKTDLFGQEIINPEYNAEMLASAVALHEGYKYSPDRNTYWKQSSNGENSFLYVTTKHINKTTIDSILTEMKDDEFLVIVCKSFDANILSGVKNITIKKIPQSLLKNCEFDVRDYNLNIICPPIYENAEED